MPGEENDKLFFTVVRHRPCVFQSSGCLNVTAHIGHSVEVVGADVHGCSTELRDDRAEGTDMSQFMNVDDIEVVVVLLGEVRADEILRGEVVLKASVEARFQVLQDQSVVQNGDIVQSGRAQ